MKETAEVLADAVKEYLDNTARAHQCAGFDCSICAINGARYTELKERIQAVLAQ